MRSIAVITVPSAQVIVDDLPQAHIGVTNSDGYVEFVTSDLPVSYIGIKAAGYLDYYQGGLNFPPGNFQIRVGIAADPGRPQDLILPPLVTTAPPSHNLTRLHVQGLEFVYEGGQRHTLCGSTELMLAWIYDTQGPEPVDRIMSERMTLGFNNLRVLWQKDINNTGSSPWQMPVEKMAPFLQLAASNYLYIQGTILADCQIVNPGVDRQLTRVSLVRQATAGITNLIEQLGNEYDKNGFDPKRFYRPDDRLAANASSTEGGKDAPYWDFFCFSGQRSPLNHAIREYGPIEFMYSGGEWGGIPAICDEGMKPGVNSSDPRDWERAGAQARSGCGGRFHTVAGTSGNSRPFDELERECAAAFVEGMGL